MSGHVAVVVVAAGRGERFGGPKHSALLGGRTLLERAVCGSRAVSDCVVAVVPEELVGQAVPCADFVVAGGSTRSESVRAGLAALPENVTVVLVHDAARPLAPPSLFRSTLDAVLEGADGAIPVVEVVDTLKVVEGGRALRTVPRDGLVAVQTPQAFRLSVLRSAHSSGGDATDDSGLVEALGAKVAVVRGDRRNLKITTPEDLELAEALLGGDQ